MRNHSWKLLMVVAGLMALLIPVATTLAEDKTDEDRNVKHIILGDEYENLTINSDGSELTISYSGDGKSKVTVVDMEQVGNLVGESLTAAMETLAEMQLEFRVGQDNTFKFAMEEQEWEVDIDAIMSEVGEALSGAFDDLDTDEWTHHRPSRVDHGDYRDDQRHQ